MDLKELLKRLKLSEQTVSTVLGALVIVVVGVLIFNYFRGVGRKPTLEKPAQPGEIKLIEEGGKIVPEGLPTTYKVEKGDHLWAISQKFFGSGYNWVDIARENRLKNPNRLLVDQELSIPKVEVRKPVVAQAKFGEPISGSSYTVLKGDHLWGIAVRAYGDGYKWVEIAKANNLANPNLIHPGNILTLPR
ncbi:MAG: LysM peptidoglycan-binding domain-containing protein [Patescibacteria group bacterium]